MSTKETDSFISVVAKSLGPRLLSCPCLIHVALFWFENGTLNCCILFDEIKESLLYRTGLKPSIVGSVSVQAFKDPVSLESLSDPSEVCTCKLIDFASEKE